MTDTAGTTVHGPLGNSTNASNAGIELSNFQVNMGTWSGPNLPPPTITGTDNTSIALNFTMTTQLMKVTSVQKSDLSVVLQGTPTTVKAGGSMALNWTTKGATSCSASGNLTGSIGTSGSRSVTEPTAGNYSYHVHCQNSADSTGATLVAAAQ
jgi:hypothetical protein